MRRTVTRSPTTNLAAGAAGHPWSFRCSASTRWAAKSSSPPCGGGCSSSGGESAAARASISSRVRAPPSTSAASTRRPSARSSWPRGSRPAAWLRCRPGTSSPRSRLAPVTIISPRIRPSQAPWKTGSSSSTSVATEPKPCRPPRSWTPSTRGTLERLVEVGHQVVDVLEADRDAHQAGADVGRRQLLGAEADVGGVGRAVSPGSRDRRATRPSGPAARPRRTAGRPRARPPGRRTAPNRRRPSGAWPGRAADATPARVVHRRHRRVPLELLGQALRGVALAGEADRRACGCPAGR